MTMNLGSGLSPHLPFLIVRLLSSFFILSFCLCRARALYPFFGEKGAGTSVIMIQLGRITTVQKFINENPIAHEYFMLGDCFSDDIKHVTLLLSCFLHVLFTNYLYDRLICHASGLSWQAIRACQSKIIWVVSMHLFCRTFYHTCF